MKFKMKFKLKVVSTLIILLCVLTTSCGESDWKEEYKIQHTDGCTTTRYKKVIPLSDRVEYKEVVECPNGETITETWTD